MQASRLFRVSIPLLVAVFIGTAPRAYAQDPAAAQALRAEMDQLRRDFETRMAALEERMAALSGTPGGGTAAAGAGPSVAAPGVATPGGVTTGAAAPEPTAQAGQQPPAQPTAEVPAGAAGGGGPTGAIPLYGNASAASKIFNPDMAVIGNFLGAMGKNTVAPEPALQLPESEVSFQAIVDPYARADFFMSFGESGVNVEEGFITFPTLPGGFLAKIGKQRAAFGKVNTLHTHMRPWADVPLVAENMLNGDDGINDAGISLARLIPNPWLFLEATGQVYRGDSGEVFQSQERSDLSYVAHLRGYQDLSESTNVDVGGSFAYGHHNPYIPADGVQPLMSSQALTSSATLTSTGGTDLVAPADFTAQLYGVDATLRWRPLQRSIYHSFIGRSEFVWSRREQPIGRADGFGFYVSGDYQFGRRWFAGVRFDGSDRLNDPSLHDSGQSLLLTYWPSEFSQVRGQYRRTSYAEGETANEFLFQFQFAIGAHGAHPF